MIDPETASEWQDVVDMAAAARALADCKMYGLIAGGPKIDIARCDALIERGRERGFTPSRPVAELAVELVRLWNSEHETEQFGEIQSHPDAWDQAEWCKPSRKKARRRSRQ